MTTETDICNRALSEIGTQSTISSLSENSPEGLQCALWYHTLRQQLLRAANWGFARRQLVLTLLGPVESVAAPYPFLFKYAYPADCLKFRYIITPTIFANSGDGVSVDVGSSGLVSFVPSRQCRWLLNTDVDVDHDGVFTKTILSNVPGALGAYTMDITNADIFDSLFQAALTSALAYKLVIPLSGNVGMKDSMRQAAEAAILQARVADGNEALTSADHSVDWISARGSGYGGAYGYGAQGAGAGWGNWYGSNENMTWGM